MSFLFVLSRSFGGFWAGAGDFGAQACPRESGLGVGDTGPKRLRARLSNVPYWVLFSPVSINCCLKCSPFSPSVPVSDWDWVEKDQPAPPLSVRWDVVQPPVPSQNLFIPWAYRLGFGAECLSEMGFEGAGWSGEGACQRKRRYF